MMRPTLQRIARTGFRTANALLNPMGIVLAKPETVHGSPAFVGALTWARRLHQMRHFLDMVRDVPGDIVESGVHWGYGLLIEYTLTMDTTRRLYGFDSFAGHSPATPEDHAGGRYQPLDQSFAVREADVWRTLELGSLSSLNTLRQRVELVPGWMQETMPAFRIRAEREGIRLAFVHADCDIYEPFKATLTATWPLLAPGGVMLVGLLNNPELRGKTTALEEFLATVPASQYALHQSHLVRLV